MLIIDLFEARRNPELNPKQEGHAAAVAFLSKIPNDELIHYGVSMTELPKLGINPSSKYNTPIGVYFYPASYYLTIKKNNNTLDFQDKAAYIQILKLNGNILQLGNGGGGGNGDADFYKNTLDKLRDMIPELAKQFGSNIEFIKEHLRFHISASQYEAKVSNYDGFIWYILWKLSSELGGGVRGSQQRYGQAKRNPVIWNKLIRMLGYSAVIDLGSGIIHQNEMFQGVALDPANIQLVKTFSNKESNPDNEIPIWNQLLVWPSKTPKQYVQSVSEYIRFNHITTSVNRKIAGKVLHKVVNFLKADPTIFLKLDSADINTYVLMANSLDDNNMAQWIRMHYELALWDAADKKEFQMLRNLVTSVKKNSPELLPQTIESVNHYMPKYQKLRAKLLRIPQTTETTQIISAIDELFYLIGYDK